VEMEGIEPSSKNNSLKLSPSAVDDLDFATPPEHRHPGG
jgi:hypothetical protein